jgi:hypothetical protein
LYQYLLFHHAFRFFPEDRDGGTDQVQGMYGDQGMCPCLRIRNREFNRFEE